MKLIAALLVLLSAAVAGAQEVPDPLRSGFEHPPNSAQPRVWWHWMNGNITKEGIQLDLEWMHRVGLGGFQNFDAAMRTPKVVDHRLVYMTPEWKDAFLYATKLADQYGMEEAIASSPGWSETGGPWVPAAEGMKKYVWSETRVEGGRPFSGILAKPPATTGPFQNMPFAPEPLMPGEKAPVIPKEFYRDSAVVAYRALVDDAPLSDEHPAITTSSPGIHTELLGDGDLTKSIDLPSAPVGQTAWIRYAFARPVTVQSITLVLAGPTNDAPELSDHGDSVADLESSEDGVTFTRILRVDNGDVGTTRTFAPVTARFFQVSFLATPPPAIPPYEEDVEAWEGYYAKHARGPHLERVTELELSSAPRVQYFQEKAAFVTANNNYLLETPDVAKSDAIDKAGVIDLTSRMRADGGLDWTPPAGQWTIVRMGYSLLGITNHPATAEATGLEVDKLNHTYVQHYMDHYLDNYQGAVGSEWIGKRGVRYVVTDSWEAGAQNWTDDMIPQFMEHRGYDPRPWLPVLTGHIVESAKASDAFLWDFRKTIADLTADEHYAQVQRSLQARGLGHYGESHEGGRAFIADGMEVKKLDDVPMSAMWTQRPGVNDELYGYDADDRESASVAHIYGQNIAAAESMTAIHNPWAWSPATLKPTADKELAEGINRFVIHCSVHQPLVGKAPGLGLGPYGQWFNRNETWADDAGAWVSYLARSSYLLQQGRFSADILYYYGEDSNITAVFGFTSPPVPEGFAYDYVNPDALIHMLHVNHGELATDSGMRYRLLVFDPLAEHMSLAVLRAIRTLVSDGAMVVGTRPTDTPSLTDNPQEFATLVKEVWGSDPGEHSFGKGKVYSGMPISAALEAMKLTPDFTYTQPTPDTKLLFVHRRLSDGDLYYVDNRSNREEKLDVTFRVHGRQAEIWHAETGKSEAAAYTIVKDQTTVPLDLEAWGAVFVVFRQPATSKTHVLPEAEVKELARIAGPWKLELQQGRGAPPSVELPTLQSWSENADSRIRYFSGRGTYAKTILANPDWFQPGRETWIDLGDVKNLATVKVNGKELGTVWHAPYRINATGALKAGSNEVTITVTNAWVNRMIGDQQPDATAKYTFTIIHPYRATSPLLPSGLLGPVTILSMKSASQ